jgi:hypothetical protein
MVKRLRILTALLGLSSVSIFVGSFMLFGLLNPDFDMVSDHISKLGVHGQPYADHWNLIGFGMAGMALAAFGWFFGMCRNDQLLGTCLMFSGIGFALAAVPTDFADAHSSLSKAHYASICFALAGWCLGLARLAGDNSTTDFARATANYSVALSLLPMVGISGGLSAEPIAHRLILAVVFTWIVLNSIQLLRQNVTPQIRG